MQKLSFALTNLFSLNLFSRAVLKYFNLNPFKFAALCKASVTHKMGNKTRKYWLGVLENRVTCMLCVCCTLTKEFIKFSQNMEILEQKVKQLKLAQIIIWRSFIQCLYLSNLIYPRATEEACAILC